MRNILTVITIALVIFLRLSRCFSSIKDKSKLPNWKLPLFQQILPWFVDGLFLKLHLCKAAKYWDTEHRFTPW